MSILCTKKLRNFVEITFILLSFLQKMPELEMFFFQIAKVAGICTVAASYFGNFLQLLLRLLIFCRIFVVFLIVVRSLTECRGPIIVVHELVTKTNIIIVY